MQSTKPLPNLVSEEDVMEFCPAFRFMKRGESISNLSWKNGTIAKVKNGGLYKIVKEDWIKWNIDNKDIFSSEFYIVEH